MRPARSDDRFGLLDEFRVVCILFGLPAVIMSTVLAHDSKDFPEWSLPLIVSILLNVLVDIFHFVFILCLLFGDEKEEKEEELQTMNQPDFTNLTNLTNLTSFFEFLMSHDQGFWVNFCLMSGLWSACFLVFYWNDFTLLTCFMIFVGKYFQSFSVLILFYVFCKLCSGR